MSAPTMPRPVADAAAVLEAAICSAWLPREETTYREALLLVTHPEAPVSTDADYPWWTPSMGCLPTPEGGAR
jgi:hypothetical protein